MKALAADATAPHRHPIELETSRTSDRSTMRRVASPLAATVTCLKLTSCMKVVGRIACAVTVTTLTPLAASTVDVKKPGSVVGVTHVVPSVPSGKLALNICAAAPRGLPLLSARAAPSAAPSTAL